MEIKHKYPINISNRLLCRYVNNRINFVVCSRHVLSILSILLEEIVKDLKDGKEIEINNFGTIYLTKVNPRYYHSVVTGGLVKSKEYRTLRFILSKKIKDFLLKFVDVDKMRENG